MIYKYVKSEPRWINFENIKGEKGGGGKENNGAKGHAWEHFYQGEEKVLCDIEDSGIVRKIWITLSNREPDILQNVFLKMYWDEAELPQVEVPIGDFFCMGLGKMVRFENNFFSTAEGRSFSCFIPMPFKKHCKIVLCNNSGIYINNLFYDIDITLQDVFDDDMHFHAEFQNIERNEIEKDVVLTSNNANIGAKISKESAEAMDETAAGVQRIAEAAHYDAQRGLHDPRSRPRPRSVYRHLPRPLHPVPLLVGRRRSKGVYRWRYPISHLIGYGC